jgi:hypothetical protein
MKKRNIQHNYVNGEAHTSKGLDKERKNNIKKSFCHTLTSIL